MKNFLFFILALVAVWLALLVMGDALAVKRAEMETQLAQAQAERDIAAAQLVQAQALRDALTHESQQASTLLTVVLLAVAVSLAGAGAVAVLLVAVVVAARRSQALRWRELEEHSRYPLVVLPRSREVVRRG